MSYNILITPIARMRLNASTHIFTVNLMQVRHSRTIRLFGEVSSFQDRRASQRYLRLVYDISSDVTDSILK